jgi:hypothetical protein
MVPLGCRSRTVVIQSALAASDLTTARIAGLVIQATNPPDLEVVLHIGHCCDDPPFGKDVGPRLITFDSPNVVETVRVPDEATALKIAEPALIKTYGKRQIDNERPLTATLDKGIGPFVEHCAARIATDIELANKACVSEE